jgi:Tfp pilus assembly protein PilN
LRNINLLPKKPLLDRLYKPILVAMLVIFIGCGILLFFSSFNTNMNMEAEQRKNDQEAAKIRTLTALHQVDPRTQDYNTFAALLQQLKDGRRDWAPLFDLITKNLYKSSRLLTMTVNDKEVISLNLEFASMNEVAYYTTLLQKSPLVDSVSVKDIAIAKKSKLLNSGSNALNATATKPTASVKPIEQTITYYSVSLEIQLKSLVKGK